MVLCRSGNTLVATSCHVFIFTMAELIDARSLEFLTESMPKLADGLCVYRLLIMPLVICVLCLRQRCDISRCEGEAYALDVLYNAKTDGGLNAGTLHTKINGKGPLLFVGKTNTKSDYSLLTS